MFDGRETVLINLVQDELPARLQRAIGAVGLAADSGKLWAGVAAVLAATGRNGRRAAAQGAVGYLAASGAANLVIKQLTRRARPGRLARFRGAISHRSRRTSSLPSSHTAGGVAFAVAASAATPAAAPLLGALALSVAADRVLRGEHYPSDVAAGALLGVAAGTTVAVVAARRRRRNGPGPDVEDRPAMTAGMAATVGG